MDRNQALIYLTANDNFDYSERLNTTENVEALVAAGTLANDLGTALLCLQQAGLLSAWKNSVIRAKEHAISLATALVILNDAGMLADESIANVVLSSGQNARSISLGLVHLKNSGILNSHKIYVINAHRNGGSIGRGLSVLKNANLLEVEQAVIIASGEHAYSIAMGLDSLEKEGIREDERATVIASGQHAVSVGAAIALLYKHNKLNEHRLEVLSDPGNAFVKAQQLVLGQDFNSRAQMPLGFLRSNTTIGVTTAHEVLDLAENPDKFYKLSRTKNRMFDLPQLADDLAHSGLEIRKMSYLFRYLQEHQYIPNSKDEIVETINRLVAFANNLEKFILPQELAIPGTRRMLKIGIDRLLRNNERISSNKDWCSRALVLGLFRAIEAYSKEQSAKPEKIINLYAAAILGIRQVVEAAPDAGICHDLYCRSAASVGFFASSNGVKSRQNEVSNLEGINPACHGRLRNLSIDLAGLLGYPESLYAELNEVLKGFISDDYIVLQHKIDQITNSDFSPENFRITDSVDDKRLYELGVDEMILSNFVEIYLGGVPVGMGKEDSAKLKDCLIEKIGRMEHTIC